MTNIILTTEQAQQIEEALDELNSVYGLHETPCVVKALAAIRAARAQEQAEQEPVAIPFNCWSTNDGDSWYEHPADVQIIYDTLGNDAKIGDEFEVSAGWNCVTARYRIVSQDGDDFEVECISHPQDNATPVEPVKQEPVGYVQYFGNKLCFRESAKNGWYPVFLNAAPVRTKDLTDDEIWEVVKNCPVDNRIEAAKAGIAADRELNK